MKFNKKRNTAFLYECLLKELTKAIVRKQDDRKNKIISIIKENFKKGSLLKEDLDVYRSVLESKKMNKEFATRFLEETKKDFTSLNRKAIFNQQTKLSLKRKLMHLCLANQNKMKELWELLTEYFRLKKL